MTSSPPARPSPRPSSPAPGAGLAGGTSWSRVTVRPGSVHEVGLRIGELADEVGRVADEVARALTRLQGAPPSVSLGVSAAALVRSSGRAIRAEADQLRTLGRRLRDAAEAYAEVDRRALRTASSGEPRR